MGELFRDIGLFAVEHMPFTLGFALAVIAFAIWGGFHAYENDHKEQLWLCGAVVVATAALVPWAHASTKEYCKNMADMSAVTMETGIPGLEYTNYAGYLTSKCHNVWPDPAELTG